MNVLSLIGIFAGLVFMIILAYKGHSIIWVAPLSAFIVVLFSVGAGLGEGRTLLSSYTVDYMQGAGNYFASWFPTFLFGAIYGKVMDITGAARSLAKVIVNLIGERFAALAVLIPCLALTYGGVSLFVVVFIMYPMGYEIYKAADLPRTLLPCIISIGAFGVTMTYLPGTPQIQNLIPAEYFGTTAFAAPYYGIAAGLITIIPAYIYVEWRIRKTRKLGIGFVEDALMTATESDDTVPSWHWVSGLLPLVVVFISLNILKWNIIVALMLGILVCFIFNINKLKMLPAALTDGSKGAVTAMMNTACAVGFGSVIKIVPGFLLLTSLLIGKGTSPISLLLSEIASTGILSAATGSASGGVSIALSAFADKYMEMAGAMDLSPEILHRVAAIGCSAMDKMPHNGSIITLLAVSHCTHKDSYKDIFIATVIIPVIAEIIAAVGWGLLFA